MSFGISVGDIILCAQITHRLFVSVTNGRKKASQDLKELQDALFGLWCALNVLEREHKSVMVRAPSNNVANLGYIIISCRDTLQELDNNTAQYRIIIDTRRNAGGHSRNQLKIQWTKILWSFRGDTFIKYRQKLQTYTDSLNLILNTFIWSVYFLFHTAQNKTKIESYLQVRYWSHRSKWKIKRGESR